MSNLFKKAIVLFFIQTTSFCIIAQEMKFTEPVKLDVQINTPAEEISPLLSPDGKTLYFSRVFDAENSGGKAAGADIWISKNATGQWQKPTNKTSWNTAASDAVIGVNAQNNTVYLLNSYNSKNGIAFSKLVNGTWSPPELISISGIEKSEFVGYYMNRNFNILLISMKRKDSYGQEDLYVSLKNSSGKWSSPTNLGATINTDGFEISPFLSENGKRLYFSSDGHKSYGDADIYFSERLNETWTSWSTPKNLGNRINSEKFDSYFSIYGDTVCYFSSNRNSDFSDIYTSSLIKKEADSVQNSSEQTETKYLTDLEIKEAFAITLDNKLLFEAGVMGLSENHKEKLISLSKILALKKNIKVRLTARKSINDDELETNQKRLFNILQYLKQLGVEGSRVTFGSESNYQQGLIVIKLYQP